ncbi:phosphatidate cytidylyltransferase [uncultured Streptomyces sp.]|uniref:phosphatidate cytidylyltransferase n=1 Tax=uncultured Streptomyces sp. TaxID=174707 RepID=UPI00261E1E6D|nr:phosphatidate cytidylyltransferase [uncultured Streptomyces sp.]
MSGPVEGAEAVRAALPLVGVALAAGGVAVAVLPARVRARTELRARWRTWAAAAPLFLGAYLLGAAGPVVLAAGLGLVAVREFARMAGLRPGDRAVLTVAAVALPVLAAAAPGALDPRIAAASLIAAALPAVLGGDAAGGFTRAARTVFGLLWIPVALTGLVTLDGAAVSVGLAVALGDVGAWCAGKGLGRRGPSARPLSALSPHKTWAGALGAVAATALALLAVGRFEAGLWAAAAGGCVLGDLIESMVKRESGVKDAGSWLPGFGGLLDRIDSLLVALLLTTVTVTA